MWGGGQAGPVGRSVRLGAQCVGLLPRQPRCSLALLIRMLGGGAQAHRAHMVSAGLTMKGVTVSTPLLGKLMLSCLVCGYLGSPGDPSLK